MAPIDPIIVAAIASTPFDLPPHVQRAVRGATLRYYADSGRAMSPGLARDIDVALGRVAAARMEYSDAPRWYDADTMARVCAQCGERFVPRPDETRAKYGARKTCGRDCVLMLMAARNRRYDGPEPGETHDPPRQCVALGCTAVLRRRRGESVPMFDARPCCSVRCARRHTWAVRQGRGGA